MESQISQTSQDSEIAVGTSVVYGLIGKCTITGIETRHLAGETLRLYKLERQRSTLSRSGRDEPAIWLPILTAKNRGLRSPMSQIDVDAAFLIFSNREHYFPLNDGWNAVQLKMDACLRLEGSNGMAKVLSYLFVLMKRQVVSHSVVNKFHETVLRNFIREVSEITSETSKQIEDKMNRAMRSKLLADH